VKSEYNTIRLHVRWDIAPVPSSYLRPTFSDPISWTNLESGTKTRGESPRETFRSLAMNLSDASESLTKISSPISGLGELSALIAQLHKANDQNRYSLNLVPSENRLSPLSQFALSSDFYNRYFFNEMLKPDFWEFRGGQLVGNFEREFTIPALRRLANAQHVCVRPISGLNTSLIVLSAYAGAQGSTVVSISPESGGHYAMQSIIRRLGYVPKVINIKNGKADSAELQQVLTQNKVALVYVDFQNSLFPLDTYSFSSIVKKYSPSTILHVDASHMMGLILGKAHENPLDFGADSFGGSTHKSFPGPHKGVVFSNRLELAEALESAHFDLVSSHHFAETIALGISAMEFEYFGKAYAPAVIANAQMLAQELSANGFNVQGNPPNYTWTHQVWFSCGNLDDTSRISQCLFEAGIRANFQKNLPGMPENSFRIGTNEITFEGATKESMVGLAKAFCCARDMNKVPAEYSAQSIRQTFKKPFYFSDMADLQHQIDMDNQSLAVDRP
jgi:glycine hydroxymethyltransferase